MVRGQRKRGLRRILEGGLNSTQQPFDIAEESYHIEYMTNKKSNSYCCHTKDEVMKCSCGEEEKEFAWVWSTKEDGGQAGHIVLEEERRQVCFNPKYSSGTASVRGNRILQNGYHHYWELKMTSAVYGTNIMLGVCTPNCDINHGIHRFCSLLGRDEESWGYSYMGTTQHAGKASRYGLRWGKGAIVGVHLDTWRGTIEFFLNREPLGVAFTGLQSKELYPIVTSTSAHSGMKLVTSYMFPQSLQFLSSELLFKKVVRKANIHPKDIPLPPGLQTHITKNYWPIIKCVGSSDDHKLDYIRVHISKRLREEDSTEAKRAKRHLHHLYNMSNSLLNYPEISLDPLNPETPQTSSSSGNSSLTDLANIRCLPVPSTGDEICGNSSLTDLANIQCLRVPLTGDEVYPPPEPYHCCEGVLPDSRMSLLPSSIAPEISSGNDQSVTVSTNKSPESYTTQRTESSASSD